MEMDFSHFRRKLLEPKNFDLIQCNLFELYEEQYFVGL